MKHLKVYIRFLLLLPVFLHIPFSAGATNVRNFDMIQGLPNSTVKCFCQDNQGFIWMGTFNGLCRYDGIYFKTFRHEEDNPHSMSENHIEALLPDGNLLWVGTENGLECLNMVSGQFRLYKTHDNEMLRRLHRIHKIGDILWVLTSHGQLFKLDDKDEYLKKDDVFGEQTVKDIMPWKNGTLLLCTQSKLIIYNPISKKTNVLAEVSLPSSEIKIFFDYKHNTLFFGCALGYESQAFKMEKDGMFHKMDIPLPADVKDITYYDNHIIWATDGKGVFQQDPLTHNIKPLTCDNLKSQAIHSLFVDNCNTLWIGTYRGGGAIYNPVYDSFHTISDISADAVTTGIVAQGDNLIVGIDGKGLLIYNRKTGESQLYNTKNGKLSGDNVFAIYLKDNKLWIAIYEKGIDCLDMDTRQVTHISCNVGSSSISKIRNDGEGWLWICGGWQLLKINLEYKSIEVCELFRHKNVYDILFGDDFLWVSCEGELLKLNRKDYKQLARYSNNGDSDGKLPFSTIRYMHLDVKGNLWVATENGGLYKLNENNKQFQAIPTFNNQVVVNMIQDEDNNYWISTLLGLYCYDDKNGVAVRYQEEDKLPCSQFSYRACCKFDDYICLGTIQGPVWFNPASLKKEHHPLKPYFTGLTVLGDKGLRLSWLTDSIRNVELKYNQNFFIVYFACPEFVTPSKVQYATMLENFDNQWQEVGDNREMRYTNVSPGTYTLHLRVSDTLGNWSNESASMTIIIRPPWWKTWWAYLLWSILSLSIIGGGLFLYLHEMKMKHRMRISRIRAESQKRIDEEKMGLFVQVAHELRTPAFLISASLEELLLEQDKTLNVSRRKIENIQGNVLRLNKLVSHVIDLRRNRNQFLILNEVDVNIRDFCLGQEIYYRSLCEQKEIRFCLTLPDENIVIKLDAEKTETILNNLISNAFKYTNRGGRIILTVSTENDAYILFRVEDNGIGIRKDQKKQIFKEYYRATNLNGAQGDGVGLASAKRLALFMNGTIELESEEGIGSTFTLRLPMKRIQNVKNADSIIRPDTNMIPASPASICTILVIDDEVETLQVIQRYLSGTYRVITATNGKEGWEIIQREMPDLIITDMMMPQMDGGELLQLVKTNSRTSHIPVILFTAKDTEEDKFEAYQQGADAYVTKPVSLKYLSLRINNLLDKAVKVAEMIPHDTEKTTRNHYTQEDKGFILTCRQILEQHLSDISFDVEGMAKEMGMSHSTLYRKINKVSGLSVKDFINEYRLHRACQMMLKGETNVTIISEKCGFTDYRTFSRAFKTKHGISPKQYMKDI